MRKRDKLKKGSVRFSKFTIVGVTNAVVDIGVLNLFLWLQPTRNPWELGFYNGIALVLANVNSYIWNSMWTFRGRSAHNKRQTVLFVIQALINVAVSNGLFLALVRPVLIYTDIPAYLTGNVAKIISILIASTISFFLMRYFVFSRRRWFGGRL